MADIASTDVAITLVKNRVLRGSPGGTRVNTVKLVFGDGALTYGAGVPMPTHHSFGMIKDLESLVIVQNSLTTNKLMWEWDYEAKKLRGFSGTTELATTATFAAQTLYARVEGW